jgi:A1 cistron-splicing factor AAR2
MSSSSTADLKADDSKIAVIGLPQQYHFGIDMKMWEIGDKFMGVQQLCHGLHYVYYSCPHDEVRQGFFHFTTGNGDAGVFKWDPSIESLVVPESIHEREAIQRATISDVKFLTGLAPYSKCVDSEASETWEEATLHISKELVDRIQPVNSVVFSSSQEFSDSSAGRIFWTNIPRIKSPPQLTPAERSEYYIDRSEYLRQVLNLFRVEHEILGELQASFILFLLGLNYEAFAQWKKILEVLLLCKEKAVSENIVLFTDFAKSLRFQIKQLPVDLLSDASIMGDDDTKKPDVFLLPLLAEFVEVCRDDSLRMNRQLGKNIDQIDREMKIRFGADWKSDFSLPVDDPVVV